MRVDSRAVGIFTVGESIVKLFVVKLGGEVEYV